MTLRQPCSLLHLPSPVRRRVVSVSLALSLTLAVYFFAFSDPVNRPCYSCLPEWPLLSTSSPKSIPPETLTITELDDLPTPPPGKNTNYCVKHFSAAYLDDLRDHAIQYCDSDDNGVVPQSRLTCFHAHIRDDNGADSFCIGSGATWDATAKRFRLDCPVRRQPDANETAWGLIPFRGIVPYWFETGPRQIFENFVTLEGKAEDKPKDVGRPQSRVGTDVPPSLTAPAFVLLVKREGNNNLWHSLMEIWSMTMSMDVLRMTRQEDDNSSGNPFYRTPEDVYNTHVVILDDHPEELTLDLWRFFSRHPIVKLKDMVADPSLTPAPLLQDSANTNIIVPLAGGSNPLWHNDWAVRDCRPTDATLLKLFVRRVFEHYQVPLLLGPNRSDNEEDKKIVVTFINRRGTRQLLGNERLLETLQASFPHVTVQSVDFATIPLSEQLRLVQETDVLIGVHGAGLTHTMFMRAGAGAVVEIQPEGLGYKGFRNLAAMTGHKYFSAKAAMVLPEEVQEGEKENKEGKKEEKRDDPEKPWQSSHVRIEEDRFLALMDVAIKSIYNEGLRNEDVI